MNPVDRIKYMIMLECKEVCDYCDRSYYVYGCERDCEYPNCTYDNNHKDFVPVEPLHNKRISGVWNILSCTGWFTIIEKINTANMLDMQWEQLLRKEELSNEK